MKKKFIIIASVILVFVMCASIFTACNKDNVPKDTFYKGTLSAQSYVSSEEAAAAFLANEVSGEATDAQYVSSTKQADLTSAEINELEISAEDKAKLTSAEKVVITYNVSEQAQAAAAAAGVSSATAATVKTKTVTVYILVIDFDYRYYVPPLAEGDVVTKSYYDEVFDQSKYRNATITVESKTHVYASGYGQSQSMDMTIRMELKCAGTFASLVMTMSDGTQSESVELFYVFKGDTPDANFDLYMKDDGEWTKIPTYSIDIDVSFTPEATNDNSYFVKTATGFKLNTEKFAQYLETALDALGNYANAVNMNSVECNAEYFVNEGRIYKSEATVSASISASGATGSVSSATTSTYGNFGTTVVQSPDGLDIEELL